MRLAPALGSVLVHVALLGPVALAIAHQVPEAAPPAGIPVGDEAVRVALVEPAPAAPIDVALFDAAPPVATTPEVAAAAPAQRLVGATSGARPRPEGAATAGTGSSSTARSTPTGAAEPGSGSAAGTPTGRGMFVMRGPTLVAPDGLLDPIARGGTAPAPVPHSGMLRDAAGGRGVVDDLATTASVARDGTVSFADKPDVDVHFHIPAVPTPDGIVKGFRDAGHAIGEWYVDPYAQTRYGSFQDLPRHLQAEPDRCATWGDMMCDDANSPELETKTRENQRGQIGFGGSMDLTAYAMKKLHLGDPWAGRKRKILDATFAERVAKGDAYHGDQLAHSSELMHANLERLWATTPGAAARRDALFDLWDECGEGEGPSGAAGAQARAMVIGWIRAYLPAGSAGAYPTAEIAALSARRASKQAFEPYAAPAAAPATAAAPE